MFTRELKTALKRHRQTARVYGGVFARNRVPRIPKRKRIAYVVNTDPAHMPGQHWVAFYMDDDTVYYFDPYGLPPIGFERIMQSRKKQLFFKRRLQGQGKMCGQYCLYFILSMQTHRSFQLFGDDLNANDRIVEQFVRHHFHIPSRRTSRRTL